MSLLLAALAGAMLWSFTEYAMHNWYGHIARGRNHFSRQHLRHHADPGWFAPWTEKARAAVIFVAIVAPLAILATGVLVGAVFTASFVLTYLGYEMLHRRIHTHAPKGAYGRWARKHHLAHHFTSPKLNHGVTSPLWDLVFRTHQRVEQVRVPRRHAPRQPWMLDSEGELRAELVGDYCLTGKPKAQPALRERVQMKASTATKSATLIPSVTPAPSASPLP